MWRFTSVRVSFILDYTRTAAAHISLVRDYTGKRNICPVLFTCAVVLVGGSNKTDGQKIYDAFKDNLKRANVSPEVKKDKI